MAIAPRITAWRRRNSHLPALVRRASSASNGVPWCPDEFGPNAFLSLLMGFGVDPTTDPSTWVMTDVSGDVLADPAITVTVGRQNEQSQSQPSSMTWTMNNTSGNYTPRLGTGVYYPYIKVGLPVELVVSNGDTPPCSRFSGFVDSVTQSWDETGNYAVCEFSAKGVLNRLGQNTPALRSPLERNISSTSTTIEYWPCEDASSSTQIGSIFSTGVPGTGVGVSYSSATGITGSDSLISVSSTGYMVFQPTSSSLNNSQWQCDWHIQTSAKASADTTVVSLFQTGGTVRRWDFEYSINDGEFNFYGYDINGSLLISQAPLGGFASSYAGMWIHCSIGFSQSGGNVNGRITIFPSNGGNGAASNFSYSGTLGTPSTMYVYGSSNLSSLDFGHLVLYNTFGFTQPGNPAFGWTDESDTSRFTRLCLEEGIPSGIQRGTSQVVPMGAQTSDTLINLLRECEAAEDGLMVDGCGQRFGLALYTRSFRYNNAIDLPVSFTNNDLVLPWSPVEDNLNRINSAQVMRKNGSSASYNAGTGSAYPTSGPGSPGIYATQITLNLFDDSTLTNRASWLVHKGTIDEDRYPSITLDFRRRKQLATQWLTLGGISSRIYVTGSFGTGAGDADMVVEGYQEQYSTYRYTVTANCSPQQSWQVWQIEDPTTGRLGTAGQTVAVDAPIGSSSISLATTSGDPLFTTVAGDFPLYLNISGLKVKVTNITGSSSPQTATVDPSTVTKTIPAGSPIAIWKNGVWAL